MPNYMYLCDDCGESIEKFFSIADLKDDITCECGGVANRDFSAEWGSTNKEYKVTSMALACSSPEEMKERQAYDKVLGCEADGWSNDGRPIFKSVKKHERYAQLRTPHYMR